MPPRLRLLRLFSALVVAVLAAFFSAGVGAPAALAHAGLLSSAPADGASVAVLPDVATLTFTEDINPAFIQVLAVGADGGTHETTPTAQGPTVTVPLPRALGAGKLAVRYRVVSKDGHPVAGEIGFTVAAPSSPTTSGSASGPASSPASGGTQPAATSASSSGGSAGASSGVEARPTTASSSSDAPIYVLSAVAGLVIAGVGFFLWRWERQRHRDD